MPQTNKSKPAKQTRITHIVRTMCTSDTQLVILKHGSGDRNVVYK
jgi:hypothetical protein